MSQLTIGGLPGLAVRLGRALERWGSRAGRSVDPDELRMRRRRRHETALATADREGAWLRHRGQPPA